MPKVFVWNGYNFFFFSDEGSPIEPCHIHISKGDEYAKIWIEPEVRLAKSYGMNSSEINMLLRKVLEKQNIIKEKWNEYFNN